MVIYIFLGSLASGDVVRAVFKTFFLCCFLLLFPSPVVFWCPFFEFLGLRVYGAPCWAGGVEEMG